MVCLYAKTKKQKNQRPEMEFESTRRNDQDELGKKMKNHIITIKKISIVKRKMYLLPKA